MISFYFREQPFDGRAYQHKLDSLSSYEGPSINVACTAQPCAIFDDETVPWTLIQHVNPSLTLAFLAGFRADFPRTYIGLDGAIYAVGQKLPVMPAPSP